MAIVNETTNHLQTAEEHSDGEIILERQLLMQESRMDIERASEEVPDDTVDEENKSDESWQQETGNSEEDGSFINENTDVQDGPSRIVHDASTSRNDRIESTWSPIERFGPQTTDSQRDNENSGRNSARLERYGNYLERYGPQLERYGSQLERFGNQLERIRPQLERCGSSLERYGPQLEALGRQLVRSGSQAEVNSSDERCRNQSHGITSLQTQTESANEGYAPQSADSCQGTPGLNSAGTSRQGQWSNGPNSRRLSRRPSFQVNDGLVRHWIRRRNIDRDLMPFNRFREERRRSLWRNDGDLRDFRRLRASWRYQDNLFNRQHQYDNRDIDIEHNRSHQENQENGGLIQQDRVRQRNEPLHQDDPEYGFVMLEDRNSPGPSRPDTSHSARRPRSHMSLRPLNVFNPPILGPIAEYNAESDEENNDPRQDVFGRRVARAREGGVMRSWVMMNSYFQTRPLFIGQGDSKAIDGPFTLQRINQDDHIYNGNERNFDLARIPRPIPRSQRAERRQQRQQLAFQAIS